MIESTQFPPWQLLVIIPSIAFLYASVGFGGASGYLAAMSLFAIAPNVMSTTSLSLNILVSSIAFISYYRAGHFSPRLLWPFLLTSIPFAFIGGYLEIDLQLFLVLLHITLTYVCFRMLFGRSVPAERAETTTVGTPAALIAGGAIGLLSGLIGIGGGIFLSPLIVMARWGSPKQAAGSAAGFILVNSMSGLLGRFAGGNFELGVLGAALLPLGILGAIGGARLGARYMSNTRNRRVLGVVLLIAVVRFWIGLV